MEKIYFKSEERTAKKGVLAPFPANYVFKKTGLKINGSFENSFFFYGQP